MGKWARQGRRVIGAFDDASLPDCEDGQHQPPPQANPASTTKFAAPKWHKSNTARARRCGATRPHGANPLPPRNSPSGGQVGPRPLPVP